MQSLHGFTWYSSEEQWKKEPAACMSHCRWPVCRYRSLHWKKKILHLQMFVRIPGTGPEPWTGC